MFVAVIEEMQDLETSIHQRRQIISKKLDEVNLPFQRHALQKREELFKSVISLLGSCSNTRQPSMLDRQLLEIHTLFNSRITAIRKTAENYEYDLQ